MGAGNTQGSQLHVVFGQGQIGSLVADRLRSKGFRVRVVRRGAQAPAPGIEVMQGDVRDAGFARLAAEGASVLYHCVNVGYSDWEAVLPDVTRSLRLAAAATGARLVVLDNLYALGRPAAPMREDTPPNPCSKKGALRQRLSAELLDAAARGELKLSIGRSSDFFGPGVTASAVFRPRNLERLLRGQSVDLLGDPSTPHAYAFAPDVADGLVTLGTREGTDGVWHLPTAFQGTTTELVALTAAALGSPSKAARMPGLMQRLVGLFSPLVKEALEMNYEWDVPFLVDDSRFRSAFGASPTPAAEAIAQTAAWIRTTRAPAA